MPTEAEKHLWYITRLVKASWKDTRFASGVLFDLLVHLDCAGGDAVSMDFIMSGVVAVTLTLKAQGLGRNVRKFNTICVECVALPFSI